VTSGKAAAGTIDADVVKDQEYEAASGLPLTSLADDATVAVYVVEALRFDVGLNVAVPETNATVPGTPSTVKVSSVIVPADMGSEKVAEMAVFTATFVAPLPGTVAVTVGGTSSPRGPVPSPSQAPA
jgi:hypothetical protein